MMSVGARAAHRTASVMGGTITGAAASRTARTAATSAAHGERPRGEADVAGQANEVQSRT